VLYGQQAAAIEVTAHAGDGAEMLAVGAAARLNQIMVKREQAWRKWQKDLQRAHAAKLDGWLRGLLQQGPEFSPGSESEGDQ
jgi:hypothetical protein